MKELKNINGKGLSEYFISYQLGKSIQGVVIRANTAKEAVERLEETGDFILKNVSLINVLRK